MPLDPRRYAQHRERFGLDDSAGVFRCATAEMGLAPGGRMRQAIYADERPLADWDRTHPSRCFVHLASSFVWRAITGDTPPGVPPTAREWPALVRVLRREARAPGVGGARAGEERRGEGAEKGEPALPENDPAAIGNLVPLGRRRGRTVREASF